MSLMQQYSLNIEEYAEIVVVLGKKMYCAVNGNRVCMPFNHIFRVCFSTQSKVGLTPELKLMMK